METQAPFDLNQAIAAWRQELAQQPGLAPADAQELEAHLRESITSLQQRGLSAAEAFLIARRRVGPSGPIAEEFVKAEPSRYWRLCLICAVAGAIMTNLWQTTLNVWAQAVSIRFEEANAPEIPAPWSWLLGVALYILIFALPVFVLAYWLLRRRAVVSAVRSPRWLLVVAGLLMIGLIEGLQWWGVHWVNQNATDSSQAIINNVMGDDVGTTTGPLMTMFGGLRAGITKGFGIAQLVQFILNALWPFCLFGLMVWLWPNRKQDRAALAE